MNIIDLAIDSMALYWEIVFLIPGKKNGRMSAYKDAMKNLLEFGSLKHYQNFIVIK